MLQFEVFYQNPRGEKGERVPYEALQKAVRLSCQLEDGSSQAGKGIKTTLSPHNNPRYTHEYGGEMVFHMVGS